MIEVIEEKFWSCVEKTSTCWLWNGTVNSNSKIPILWVGQTCLNAKKISLQINGRPISKRIGYTCQNIACVNPAHLVSGDEERFWSHVIKMSNGCWLWTSHTGHMGHGTFKIEGRNIQSTHYSWLLHMNRKVPDGICLCHTCDEPRCVNPNHLFLGTRKDNNIDRDQKDRQAKGEKHGHSKLNEQSVLLIRGSELTNDELSILLKVDRKTIKRVREGKSWKSVTQTQMFSQAGQPPQPSHHQDPYA
jgi:hypothetical protein